MTNGNGFNSSDYRENNSGNRTVDYSKPATEEEVKALAKKYTKADWHTVKAVLEKVYTGSEDEIGEYLNAGMKALYEEKYKIVYKKLIADKQKKQEEFSVLEDM